MPRRQSSATWLLLAHIGLILYASLYPFWPLRAPPGLGVPWLFSLPWPTRFYAFDVQRACAEELSYYPPFGMMEARSRATAFGFSEHYIGRYQVQGLKVGVPT